MLPSDLLDRGYLGQSVGARAGEVDLQARGGARTRGRLSEDLGDSEVSLNGVRDVSEALRLCGSASFAEKKTGVELLHEFFRAETELSDREVERVTSAMTRMFVDPHNKLGTVFMDALADFVPAYRAQLSGWLYVLLTRLLTKCGSDALASVQSRVRRCLLIVRSSFPAPAQLAALSRFLCDPAQTPSLKVKVVTLDYLREVLGLMSPSELSADGPGELRKAVLKIIQWTSDPKSQDVRRASAATIVALFSINASEFARILEHFDKRYQVSQTQFPPPCPDQPLWPAIAREMLSFTRSSGGKSIPPQACLLVRRIPSIENEPPVLFLQSFPLAILLLLQ